MVECKLFQTEQGIEILCEGLQSTLGCLYFRNDLEEMLSTSYNSSLLFLKEVQANFFKKKNTFHWLRVALAFMCGFLKQWHVFQAHVKV